MIEAGQDLIGNPRVTQLRDAPSPTSRGSTTLSSASANDPPPPSSTQTTPPPTPTAPLRATAPAASCKPRWSHPPEMPFGRQRDGSSRTSAPVLPVRRRRNRRTYQEYRRSAQVMLRAQQPWGRPWNLVYVCTALKGLRVADSSVLAGTRGRPPASNPPPARRASRGHCFCTTERVDLEACRFTWGVEGAMGASERLFNQRSLYS